MTQKNLLDLRGLKCPSPIVRLNAEVDGLDDGAEFEALADDPAFGVDVDAWCELTGHELVALDDVAEGIKAHIRVQAD